MNNIKDLTFDKHNYNRGTLKGDKLLDKSIRKFGYRQPAVIDKHGNIVAGNKRIAKAGELGIEEVQIIKGDPNKITVIQFDDFDLENDNNTKEYALADNITAKENIDIDVELAFEELGLDITNDWELKVESFEEIEDKELTNNETFSITFKFDPKDFIEIKTKLLNAQDSLKLKSQEEVLLNFLNNY